MLIWWISEYEYIENWRDVKIMQFTMAARPMGMAALRRTIFEARLVYSVFWREDFQRAYKNELFFEVWRNAEVDTLVLKQYYILTGLTAMILGTRGVSSRDLL